METVSDQNGMSTRDSEYSMYVLNCLSIHCGDDGSGYWAQWRLSNDILINAIQCYRKIDHHFIICVYVHVRSDLVTEANGCHES